MQRAATILTQLETCLSASPEALARRLGVGVRTVATEVAALNQTLGRAGSVRIADGRYRLLVVDAERYRAIRDEITGERESFNDPDRRPAFILARLIRTESPVRTDELAAEMAVGAARSVATSHTSAISSPSLRCPSKADPTLGCCLKGPSWAVAT